MSTPIFKKFKDKTGKKKKNFYLRLKAKQVKAKLVHDGLLLLAQSLPVPWIAIWNPCRRLGLNDLHNILSEFY